MKQLIKTYPNASRILLAAILFAFVLIISGFINKGLIKRYVPYVSCILLFATTWFLLKTERKLLKAIGLNFNKRNLLFLPLGILIGIFAFFGAKLLRALYVNESLELTTSFDYPTILLAFYFILPQVATEELLFRGYLFKKTIEISNHVVANILFSVLFMIIHVIDNEVMGNAGMMIFLIVSIPVAHLLFATALVRSKTLFFPIGIHLGNNWATRHLIGSSNTTDSIFYISNPNTFETWTPFFVFLFIFNGFYLLVTFMIWKWDKILLKLNTIRAFY